MSVVENSPILVVDDDRLVLTVLVSGLRDAGFDVIQADNGDDAILLAREYAPVLAILDMQMHGTSGLDVARFLAEQTDIAFMFLTAYGDPDLVAAATRYGAMGYLLKPLDVKQIIPTVYAAIARAQELRALRNNHDRSGDVLSVSTPDETEGDVQSAIGILMERYGHTRAAAAEELVCQANMSSMTRGTFSRLLVEALDRTNRENRTVVGIAK